MAVGVCLSANALFTVKFFEDYIGATLAGSLSEDILVTKINSSSQTIANYLGYEFHRQAVTSEPHRALPDYRLVLRQQPLLSVTSVVYDAETLDVSDYEVDTRAGSVRLAYPRFNGSYQVPATSYREDLGSAKQEYEVTYESGYVTHAQANEPSGTYEDEDITLPYDILMAGADLALLYTKNHGLAGAGIPVSETIGDASKDYSASLRRGAGATAASMALGMPDWIATRLQRYRAIQVG